MNLEQPAAAGNSLRPDHSVGTAAFARGKWPSGALPQLAGIGPLLPGGPDKRPLVGDGWQTHAGVGIHALQGTVPECVCWHVGADDRHIAIDIDGSAAAAFCQQHGCDPYTADTWRIIRTGNRERLKLVFRVTTDQKATLAGGSKTVKIEGQELAVFAKPGHQIVVLGQHYTKQSGFTENDDQYAWAGRAPAEAQPLPPEWFTLLEGVFCGDRPLKPPTRRTVSNSARGSSSTGEDWLSSSQQTPCPVCGRDHSGACSISRDGNSVWCCHGETKSAPDCSQAGERVTGTDGRVWGYVRTTEHDSFGERSLFVLERAEPTFEQRWAALEDHASEIHSKAWPGMKAIAALASKASELDLHRLSQRNLEQLLEGAQRRARPAARPVEPGGSFAVTATHWAVDGVFRHGLNLLTGQPGAGKSRLAAAAMAAWLRGDATWLSRDMPCSLPVEQRHALIVGSDQPLEDWALTLEPVGLAQRITPTEVRLHPRVTLHALESGTILDSDGLALIRRWADEHPSGMVLIDSLAACFPPGVDEDKAGAARPVHLLQEAMAGGWGILTHHTRKGAGREGNLGVGAGRGSSAIDGAVSRVVGLGLIHKMENGLMVPQEADPRRELLSTKRGGATLHIVVCSDASGYWSNEGDAAELKRQERRERTVAGLTDQQSQVLAVLEEADGWLTGRQVAEGLLQPGEQYDARGAAAATCRKTLRRLVQLGLIEAVRTGLDQTYRIPVSQVSPCEFEIGGSNGSNAAAQGISLAHPSAHTGSHRLTPCATALEPGEPGEPLGEPVGEPPKPTAPQRVSQVSQSNPTTVHGWVEVALTALPPQPTATAICEWLTTQTAAPRCSRQQVDRALRSHHAAAQPSLPLAP